MSVLKRGGEDSRFFETTINPLEDFLKLEQAEISGKHRTPVSRSGWRSVSY